jgi:L-ribulose-5-phosphate 3-epimerase
MKRYAIGVIIQLAKILEEGIDELLEMGLESCQISCWDQSLYTSENAKKVIDTVNDKIWISALWAGWHGPAVWNFTEGPLTLGLVPREYRAERIDALKKGSDFAAMIGVSDVVTHVGFIPENPYTTLYHETVIAIREVASYCKKAGQYFNFETGQETPTTLIRTIEDVDAGNLGINLDPANLILYGKGNPVDAADIYRSLVRGVHIKDGIYPTNGRDLGREMPLGEGLVDFPKLLKKLADHGYKGAFTIEREISGEQQIRDIFKAKDMLEKIISSL